MSSNTMFEGFDAFGGPYAGEARERWGETDAYRESMRRAKKYSKADWAQIKAAGEEPVEALMALLPLLMWLAAAAGTPPTDPAAMDAADRARLHIDRWFYPCSREFHVGLASLYESDARFAEHYEKRAPGLRDYVVAAIRANAERTDR